MGILSGIKLFSSLTEKEKKDLEIFCQERIVKAGEYVFHEGDDANAMYVLAEGIIEVSKQIDYRNVVLGQVKAEEILGEMALYDSKGKRTASAVAVVDTKLVTILAFSIKQIEKDHPEVLVKIKDVIKQRKKNNEDKMGVAKKITVLWD